MAARNGHPSFAEFMHQVDRELAKRCGLTHRDLTDWAYHDAYDDECEPAEVAVLVLRDNDFPFE